MATTVRCNVCGVETDRQPAGDGCHSCLKGTMEEVYNDYAPYSGPYEYYCRTLELKQREPEYGIDY